MAIHIGEKIKDVVYHKRISHTEFAKMLGKNPKYISRIFHKQDIHCKLLKNISELLKHDFFQYYITGSQSGGVMNSFSSLEKEIETLRKENGYLKQINELLAGRK